MKRLVNLAVLLTVLLICALASAQTLADAARAAKAEKKPTDTKKVYTNDDFTSTAPAVPASEKGPAESAASGEAKDAKAAKADDKSPKADDRSDKTDKEKSAADSNIDEWKKQVDGQKKAVEDIEHELSLMEREHQVRVSVYYADAGTQLRDSKKWFEDEKKYEVDHTAKQKSLADARQKLDDLKEQARHAGVPAGQID